MAACRQAQTLFFAALLFSAEAARVDNPPLEPVAASAEGVRDDRTSHVENSAAEKATKQKNEPVSSSALLGIKSADELMTTDKSMGIELCDDFCITCPADGGSAHKDESISWTIVRARGWGTKLSGGIFAIALATLGVTSGVLVVPTTIAGAAAAVGVSTKTVLVGGTLAGAILAKDFLQETRLCRDVEFHQTKHANNRNWFKKTEKEETYTLDDVNLLELMGQMEDVQGEPWLQDYVRNKNVPEKERLGGLMACNLMLISERKWGDMRFQDPNFRNLTRIFRDKDGRPSLRTAAVAECGKWLCSTKFEDPSFAEMQVKEMGSNWHGFKQCGGRSMWNSKNWFRK